MRRVLLMLVTAAGVGLVGWAWAEPRVPGQTKKDKKEGGGELPPPAGTASDVEVVKRTVAARKEYEESLRELRAHYSKAGDKQRLEWAEQELMAFHLTFKPSYNLDVQDAFPPTLEAAVNIKEANELYRHAMEYKGKGLGNDFVLNMRRAEYLFRELLEKHPTSDKIGEAAYQLAEIYESRAYRQFDRAARYFERSFQWVKGSRTDARLRAAILYDRYLNERGKSIELYRSVVEHDVDSERIKIAQKRLDELTGNKK
jgi:hypothetical protein